MNEENKFYKYVDDQSILVITPNNKLIRLHCPFAVKDVNNKIFRVDAVYASGSRIIYKIQGQQHFHSSYFML